jgi:hypothetical protein
MYSEYTDLIVAGGQKLPPQAAVGSGLSFMVGRLSYTFGFTGGHTCWGWGHGLEQGNLLCCRSNLWSVCWLDFKCGVC